MSVAAIEELAELELRTRVAEVLNRWPTAGLAAGRGPERIAGVVYGHGVADIATNSPVTEDTVFRIGSISKASTAIAAVQLREQGAR